MNKIDLNTITKTAETLSKDILNEGKQMFQEGKQLVQSLVPPAQRHRRAAS